MGITECSPKTNLCTTSAMLSLLVAGLALTGGSFRVTSSSQPRVSMMAKKEEEKKGFFLADFLSAPTSILNPSFKANRPGMSLLAPDDSRDVLKLNPWGRAPDYDTRSKKVAGKKPMAVQFPKSAMPGSKFGKK